MRVEGLLCDPIILALLRNCTSKSTDPRSHFQAFNTVCAHFCYSLPCYFLLLLLQKSIYTITTTVVSPSLHQTSAPIQNTIVFGVLGTQETSYYLVVVLFERDHLHPMPPTD